MTAAEIAVGLLPCPFCGASAHIFDYRDVRDAPGWGVNCDQCDAGSGERDTQAEAIATWNTRPPAAGKASELAEELESRLDRTCNGNMVNLSTAEVRCIIDTIRTPAADRNAVLEEGFDLAIHALLAWADGFIGPCASADFCRSAASDLERNRAAVLALKSAPVAGDGGEVG